MGSSAYINDEVTETRFRAALAEAGVPVVDDGPSLLSFDDAKKAATIVHTIVSGLTEHFPTIGDSLDEILEEEGPRNRYREVFHVLTEQVAEIIKAEWDDEPV